MGYWGYAPARDAVSDFGASVRGQCFARIIAKVKMK